MTDIQPQRGWATCGPKVSCGSHGARPWHPLPRQLHQKGPGSDWGQQHRPGQLTRPMYGAMLLELGASTSLREEAILLAVRSLKWQFYTKKCSQCKKMPVTHSEAASPPAPGADGHGRTRVSGVGGVCVWWGALPGGDGCWRAGGRRAGAQLVEALALL